MIAQFEAEEKIKKIYGGIISTMPLNLLSRVKLKNKVSKSLSLAKVSLGLNMVRMGAAVVRCGTQLFAPRLWVYNFYRPAGRLTFQGVSHSGGVATVRIAAKRRTIIRFSKIYVDCPEWVAKNYIQGKLGDPGDSNGGNTPE